MRLRRGRGRPQPSKNRGAKAGPSAGQKRSRSGTAVRWQRHWILSSQSWRPAERQMAGPPEGCRGRPGGRPPRRPDSPAGQARVRVLGRHVDRCSLIRSRSPPTVRAGSVGAAHPRSSRGPVGALGRLNGPHSSRLQARSPLVPIRNMTASMIPHARLQPSAPISIALTSSRPAAVAFRETVNVRTMINPKRTSLARANGSSTRRAGFDPATSRLPSATAYEIASGVRPGAVFPVTASSPRDARRGTRRRRPRASGRSFALRAGQEARSAAACP